MAENLGWCGALEIPKVHFSKCWSLNQLLIKETTMLSLKHMCCFEEKLLDNEISYKRFKNLDKDERNAAYNLKDDKTIKFKGAEKGSAVIAWQQDYFK